MRSRASVRTRSRSSRCSLVSWSHAMTDRLDVVAVGVEDERTVIVLVIPAEAWRAVVGAAGGEAGSVERVDGRPFVAGERDVGARPVRLALVEPEQRTALDAEADDAVLRDRKSVV